MEIRQGNLGDGQAIRSLWAYAFEKETDPWFQWYFTKAYRPEDVLVGTLNGSIVSQLHRRPYTISVRGKACFTDYIVGVSTHPAARGRGLGKALIREAFYRAKRDGKGVVILMPSAASFYYPLGFSLYAWQWQRTATPEVIGKLGVCPVRVKVITSMDDYDILATLYDIFTRDRNGYAVRNKNSWQVWLDSLWADGGHAVVFYDEEKPVAYMAYSIDEKEMSVSEWVCTTDMGRRYAYFYMGHHEGSVSRCRWQEAADDRSFLRFPNGAEHTYIENTTLPFMMGRVVNPIQAFSGMKVSPTVQGEVTFMLSDDVMAENDGIYTLSFCQGEMVMEREKGEKKVLFHIDIACLTALLFGSATFSSLREEGILAMKDEEIAWLDGIFGGEKNWINEWF